MLGNRPSSAELLSYCTTPILVKCHRQLHFNATAAGSVQVNDRPKYSALSAKFARRWWWRGVNDRALAQIVYFKLRGCKLKEMRGEKRILTQVVVVFLLPLFSHCPSFSILPKTKGNAVNQHVLLYMQMLSELDLWGFVITLQFLLGSAQFYFIFFIFFRLVCQHIIR